MEAKACEWRWRLVVVVVTVALALALQAVEAAEGEPKGAWRVVTKNAGITAMHAAVAPVKGTVILIHQTNNGPSNLTFPGDRCRKCPYDRILTTDCFVHSVVLDPTTGAVRPLMILTDTQCSSGQFLADGTLGQTGGDREGTKITRTLSTDCYFVKPTDKICDWVENSKVRNLTAARWYASNQLLPDGRQIIVGGRGSFSYEFSPPTGAKAVYFPFLHQTTDGPNVTANGPNNLYPYVHLMPSTGYLYIFANRDSILFDYVKNVVVRVFPKIPGNPRNYPSGGSSVMLPLTWQGNFQKVEVLVCGGATNTSGNQMPCSVTCGRIEVTRDASAWTMENMPMPRCMGDMVLLPDTNVLIINGAQKGWQGWLVQSVPALNPVLYEPKKKSGERFTLLKASVTPRVYHSTANLLPDASVMVAGSNTNEFYSFTKGKWWPPPERWWPTELSVEAFAPPYAKNYAGGRPTIMSSNRTDVKFDSALRVVFWDYISPDPKLDTFLFTVASPAFSTHSYAQGQRLVSIKPLGMTTERGTKNGVSVNIRTVDLQIPLYQTVLPKAYYMLFVVKNGNPSKSCIWIRTRT